ncbi:MAG: hydroxymethylglutaryl-CoA reductase [Bacteroidia bacterium]
MEISNRCLTFIPQAFITLKHYYTMLIPSLLLKQLYTFGSLKNTDGGVRFSLKNRLSDATLTGIHRVCIGDHEVAMADLTIVLSDGRRISPDAVTAQTPIDFPLKDILDIEASMPNLPEGKYKIEVGFEAKPFGKLNLKVEGGITREDTQRVVIPRGKEDDYDEEVIKIRQQFVEQYSGKKLAHIPVYSFDPHITKGNVEHFTGVAQIPIGMAGPLTIHGEYAQGDFIVPMATTEGTLVASYNRGIKLLNACGGVKCTIVDDAMQRAPVFVMKDARAAREFVKWVKDNFAVIAEHAEATTSIGKLIYIDHYTASKFAYLRFNYTTGDAAGQNMVGRATFAACSWILDHYKEHPFEHFYLESNLATDKKASQVNIMHTRGKRVTAEALVKRDVLNQHMRVDTHTLAYHWGVANVGAILSGANNNGLHSANAITAIFIATGQDVANVAESSAGIVYAELQENGDLYFSITIPSLIVATYGGGTGLATQRECLDILGCYGRDKVRKFAEIIAGVVLAGELSLASAISSSDWVSSHEQYGRNR